jgi:hypothetical protein
LSDSNPVTFRLKPENAKLDALSLESAYASFWLNTNKVTNLVELVRLYSNPRARLETLPQLLVKAASSTRPRKRPHSRQSQVRLDPQQANALAATYKEGGTIKQLANDYGIHPHTVTAVVSRLGVEPRRVGLTDEQAVEACRLYPAGWSLARLAERYEVAGMTVRRYLLLAGVVMRSPNER